jgi:hypothetical protein
VQLVGWASVIAAGGGPALAQVAARRAKTAKAPAPRAPAAEKPPEISAEAKSLGEVVRQRYGEHLGPDDLAAVVRDLDADLRAVKRLREARLANSDEPDVTFRA